MNASVPFPIPIDKNSPFSLSNLPFGIFSTRANLGLGHRRRAGIAIGSFVIELHLLARNAVIVLGSQHDGSLEEIFLQPVLNDFANLPATERTSIRTSIIENLSTATSPIFTDAKLNTGVFTPMAEVEMHMPMRVTDYTDSFSSLIHAQNCLHPLGLEIPSALTEYPMGYNGRVSTLCVSGTQVIRPQGYFVNEGDRRPTFQETKQLDFEVELGAFISKPIPTGTRINAKEAADHIFGYVLLNDWSARDIQKYEMPPLGPFHSKGFITTISPWIVTLDALRYSMHQPPPSNSTDIHPMLVADDSNHGVYDIQFSAKITRGTDRLVELVRSSFTDSYWSIPQMIAYQSSSLIGLHTGDLVASGTISSKPPATTDNSSSGTIAGNGCLLEVFAQKHVLPAIDGKPMSWLQDGDELTMEGWFPTSDGGRAGFGPLTSLVVPALKI